MKFQLNFSDTCDSLNHQIGLVEQACQYLYQSRHIQTLLEVRTYTMWFFFLVENRLSCLGYSIRSQSFKINTNTSNINPGRIIESTIFIFR